MIKRGNVCSCTTGKVGVVTHEKDGIYYGVAVDGSNWQSKSPELLAVNIKSYINKKHLWERK